MLEDILSVEEFEKQFNHLWRKNKHGDALVLAFDFVRKLDATAEYRSEGGEYEAAKEIYLQAQRIYRLLFKMHPAFASNLNGLAEIYYLSGEYEKAELLYQEALEVWRSVLGASHPHVAVALNNLGQLFTRIGQYEKAESLLQQALELRREGLTGAQGDVAQSLDNLAMVKYRQGQYQEAEPLFLEALELRRIAVGEEHPAFATIMNNLSLLHETKSEYSQAIDYVTRASAIWQKMFGEQDSRFASSLNNLGVLYTTIGDYERAEKNLHKALELRRKYLPATDSYIGDTLNNLAMLYQEVGRYEEAERCYRDALNNYQSLPGEEHFEISQTLDGLASLFVARGDYSQAETYYYQALNMARQTLGNQHPNVARCLNSLAVLYKTIGQYERAQGRIEESLSILQPLGMNHPLYMLILDNLASVQYAQGNYAQAEIYYQQVFNVRRDVLGEDHPEVAQSLNSLAMLYRLIGDNAKAQNFYRQALAVTRKALGEKHADVAQILNNMAFLYDTQNDFVREEELLQQAYAIWKDTLPAHHPYIGTVLDNLATVQQRKGDYEQADLLCQQALAIRREAYGNDHLEVALSLNNLAVLHDMQGQWTLAEPLYQEALAIQLKMGKGAHPDTAQTLRNLASLYAAMQRYTEALSIVQQAAAIDDRIIGQVFSLGSENQRLVYLTTLQETLDGFLSLIVQHLSHLPEAVQAGFDLVSRRKALSAEALLVQRESILRGRYPELKSQLDRLALLRSQIGQKVLEEPDSEEEKASYQQVLETWYQEQEQLERDLVHKIPEMDVAQRFQQADRRAIAMALPAGSFLIEFIYLNTIDFHAIPAQDQAQWQPAHYIAFLLKAQEPEVVQVIDLGEASVIDEKINAYRSIVMQKAYISLSEHEQQAGEDGSISEQQDHGEARAFVLEEAQDEEEDSNAQSGFLLRRLVFDPLLPVLHECKKLFIAPDGDLSWLPFAALPQEHGRYLIDEYQVTYLTTGRDILRFTAPLSAQSAPSLVIADPDFDLRLEGRSEVAPPVSQEKATLRGSSDLERNSLHFARLVGTQLEGEQIAALLQVTPILQEKALDAHIKSYRSPFILHIATHGFFLSDQLHEEGAKMIWGRVSGKDDNVGDRLERLSRRRIENPLLRSGLAVAGVNTWSRGQAVPQGTEDGLLLAEDIANMDLTGTELVVLSACETGLGQVHIGEGIFGMRRAFTVAGAKTLVMTLWKVKDQQTQALMLDFYQRILQGQPRATALREAQLALKALYPHPYYWGAFICQGADGPLPALPAGARKDEPMLL